MSGREVASHDAGAGTRSEANGHLDRFVVGTGRCGSTLLSRMLATHADVVSIHEFFTGLDWGRRLQPGLVDGEELAAVVGAEQPVTTEVLRRGHITDEIQYPFGAPQARHALGDPVPWLSITMLSRLTDDPDPAFDELLAWCRARPPATMPDHYRALFGWVARRFGAEGVAGATDPVWIERSGSSLDYLGELVAAFPEARFCHIHRDGHEAALSIRDHRFFRLGVAVFMDLFPPDLDEAAQITHVIETPPPLWAVGRFWGDQVLRGFAALGDLDRDQYLAVRFEDLVDEPRPVLARIARFFDLPDDEGFVERGSALVRGRPAERFEELGVAEQDELREACRAGQMLLGRA